MSILPEGVARLLGKRRARVAAPTPPMGLPPVEASPPPAQPQFDPNKHTVPEVLAYLVDNPDDRKRVLAAERKGKNRKTIVN